jgi:methylisocitrate lyase
MMPKHAELSMSERLREMLKGKDAIQLGGCYDSLSAMLLEQAGFPAVFLSGYGVAASVLGNPDIGLTSLLETSFMTRNVCARLNVPVIVDIDNGYGNEDNVVRTVHEIESGGAAGLILEDQVMPKRCGHTGNKEIVPLPVYMRKLEAALMARRTSLVVVARTDALDIDEGIARAKTFHAAGADVVLIDGLKSMEALRRVGEEVPGPKQVNLIYGGVTPMLSAAELQELGFKIVLYSTPALFLAVRAMQEHLPRLLKTGNLSEISDASCAFKDVQGFLQMRYLEKNPCLAQTPDTATETKQAAIPQLHKKEIFDAYTK